MSKIILIEGKKEDVAKKLKNEANKLTNKIKF